MKKILLTAISTLFFLASFAQSQFSGIILYVPDSAAYTSLTTVVNGHATGKADIFWNAQATTPHFDWWDGSAYVHGFGSSGGGGTPGGSDTQIQFNNAGAFGGDPDFTFTGGNLVTATNLTAGSSTSLTDGAAITITGTKHNLTSTQPTVTWTFSQTGDYQTTDIILNATTTTYTFPVNTLCVYEGVASGDNTAVLSGTSGDHYIMSTYKDGTNYRTVIKNFGQ